MMALLLLLLTLARRAAAGFTVRFESVSIVNTGSAAGGSVSGVPENFYAVREGGAWAPSAATSVGRVAPWQSANHETPGLSLEQRWRVSATGGEHGNSSLVRGDEECVCSHASMAYRCARRAGVSAGAGAPRAGEARTS